MAKTRGKLIKKVEKIAGKAFDKLLLKKFTDMPLEGQVAAIRRMMRFSTVHNIRRDLLNGLPRDIEVLANKGMSQEEIKKYYWDCEPFRDLWCNTLEMAEATFDELLRGTLVDYAVKP